MKKFDAHIHIGEFGGWAKVSMTPERMIELMDEFEIEQSLVCCEDNEATLQAIRKYPDRIKGAVYVNPLNPDSVQHMADFIERGCIAVKLNPLRHAFVADDAVVDPVMETARKYNIPVCIHCGHPPYSLPWSIALLAERFPDVKVMMIHMGHGHGVYIDATLKMARRYPNLYLEMSGMPMESKIKEAYDTVGHDRIMFGTDGPFHHPSIEIQKVKVCGLPDQALEEIFYDNARKFLGLDNTK